VAEVAMPDGNTSYPYTFIREVSPPAGARGLDAIRARICRGLRGR
jgi:hypothetical protein